MHPDTKSKASDFSSKPKVTNRRAVLEASAASALLATVPRSFAQTRVAARRAFVTRDGTRISYLEAGKGRPLVLVPGSWQTAAEFGQNIDELARWYRVIAVDMRGHGESDKPAHGYRMSRFAADLRELIVGLNLTHVALGGHSMGAGVCWAYWDAYGKDRVSAMIVIDQGYAVTALPSWSAQKKAEAGAIFDGKAAYDTADAVADPVNGAATLRKFVDTAFFTPSFPQSKKDFVYQENLKIPGHLAAKIFLDHWTCDWSDVIPRITVPTLVVGGGSSLFSPASAKWVADNVSATSELHVFEAGEGGSHFMFMENPTKFNAIVDRFLKSLKKG